MSIQFSLKGREIALMSSKQSKQKEGEVNIDFRTFWANKLNFLPLSKRAAIASRDPVYLVLSESSSFHLS